VRRQTGVLEPKDKAKKKLLQRPASLEIGRELRLARELRRLVHAQVAGKEQNQNNQYGQAYAADGVIAPVLAVSPRWKTPHKRYDKNYRENEQERHDLAASLAAALDCFSDSIWADSATRGSAISLFTLASTAR
jgi:hypothetical protein